MAEKIELPGFEVEVPAAHESEKMLESEISDIVHQTPGDYENPEDYVQGETGPAYGSDEWNDYVMSLFTKDEMFNGNPLCIGLRRVANKLLGSIVCSRPIQVFPSMNENAPGRATVVYELVIDWGNTGQLRTFGDAAEVWHGNTDDLFCAHAAATATSKAEGRCLRKALMVKCVAAEELANGKDVAAIVRNSVGATVKVEAKTTGEMSASDKISDAQVKFIENKSKQVNVDVYKYMNMDNKYDKLSDITKKVASDMIQNLNIYQGDATKIPEAIKGWDKDWRNSFKN